VGNTNTRQCEVQRRQKSTKMTKRDVRNNKKGSTKATEWEVQKGQNGK
jgi:hypothetical protein